MAIQTSDNKWSPANWIVSPTAGQGDFTTIEDACTALDGVGGTIVLKDNDYIEDFTLPAGITLTTWCGVGMTPTVTITGKITFSAAGSSTISGIRLKTNGDNFLSFSGSGSSFLTLRGCYLDCTDNDGISYTNSNASSILAINYSRGDLGTTGIKFFDAAHAGGFQIQWSQIGNSGGSTTASTASSGQLSINYSNIFFPITTSGTNNLGEGFNSYFFVPNVTPLTLGGSSTQQVIGCQIDSGTASAISISSDAQLIDCYVNCSNANAITGAGSVSLTDISFLGSSSTINPTLTITGKTTEIGTLELVNPLTVPNGGSGLTTLTDHSIQVGAGTSSPTQLSVGATGTVLTGSTGADPVFSATPTVTSINFGQDALNYYDEGSWTPGIAFGGGTTGITYGSRIGLYTRIGRMVTCTFIMVLTSKGTDTGTATLTGLPFTVTASGIPPTPIIATSVTFTSVAFYVVDPNATTTTCAINAQTTTPSYITRSDPVFTDTSNLRGVFTYFV